MHSIKLSAAAAGRRLLLIFWVGGLLLAICNRLQAQELLLEEEVPDSLNRTFGPNRMLFLHLQVGVGFAAGPQSAGMPQEPWRSANWSAGLNARLKYTPYTGLGLELNYVRDFYLLRQEESKTFPYTRQFDQERFIVQQVGANVYHRFFFSGNKTEHPGFFLDVGGGLLLPLELRHQYHYQDPDEDSQIEVRRNDLPYKETFVFQAIARAGWNRFALFARYRLTPVLNPDEVAPRFSPFHFGLSLGIY